MSAEKIVRIAIFLQKASSLCIVSFNLEQKKVFLETENDRPCLHPERPKPAAEQNRRKLQKKNLNNQYYKRKKKISDVTVMWVLPYFITMLANRADVNENMYKYIYKVFML